MNIHSLNFTQLVRFLTLAEELHFTRSAEKLNIAQPLLSEQIRNLEQAVDAKLFIRTSRRVELTTAGKIFRDRAQLIVQGMHDAVNATHEAIRGSGMRLRIGYTDEYSGELLPECIQGIKSSTPSSELNLVMGMAQDLVEMLKMSVIDVALVCPIPEEQLPDNDFSVLTLPALPLAVALPVGHKLTKRRMLRPRDIVDEPFIEGALDPQNASERVVNRLFSYLGLQRNIVQRVSDVELNLSLVAGGVGIFIASFSKPVYARAGIAIRELQADGANLTRAVMWRSRSPSPILQRFLNLINDSIS